MAQLGRILRAVLFYFVTKNYSATETQRHREEGKKGRRGEREKGRRGEGEKGRRGEKKRKRRQFLSFLSSCPLLFALLCVSVPLWQT
jgi:hypothetical protein